MEQNIMNNEEIMEEVIETATENVEVGKGVKALVITGAILLAGVIIGKIIKSRGAKGWDRPWEKDKSLKYSVPNVDDLEVNVPVSVTEEDAE